MSFHENEAILVTHTHYYSTTTTFKKCSQLLITLIPILVLVRVMRISRVVKYRLETRFVKSVWDGKCDVILINQVSLLSCPIFELVVIKKSIHIHYSENKYDSGTGSKHSI